MRIGIAHHLGWAVAVTASPDHAVVDRRRIELVEPGLPAAPIHHEGGTHELHQAGRPLLDDAALAALVDEVRSSITRCATAALDELADAVDRPVVSISVRDWPDGLPDRIEVLRRAPHESRVDSYRYCQVLAEVAEARGWTVHRYDARTVIDDASRHLGDRASSVIDGPRATLGPPWSKDHRTALAATVVAAHLGATS